MYELSECFWLYASKALKHKENTIQTLLEMQENFAKVLHIKQG